MRWNPFAAPPLPPENVSLLGRVQELASRELITTRALLTDFQEFIQQGNMLNMAVGLILGSSFPLFSTPWSSTFCRQSSAYSQHEGLRTTTGPCDARQRSPCAQGRHGNLEGTRDAGAVTINYGLFIENVMNFIINALFLFLAVKKGVKLIYGVCVILSIGVRLQAQSGRQEQCPYCKEFVKGAATRCKDCGSDISSQPSTGG
ncbi:Large-conductance mechanosensitive channel [Phytophthora cactorum]|nr:Large-conductance mechanosensitive channel [Phytophthora cactorum]